MSGPRTEAAGSLDGYIHGVVYALLGDDKRVDLIRASVAKRIAAIEDQAAATERARIAALVEALPWESLLRHQNGDDTVSRAAVLAAIEGEPHA